DVGWFSFGCEEVTFGPDGPVLPPLSQPAAASASRATPSRAHEKFRIASSRLGSERNGRGQPGPRPTKREEESPRRATTGFPPGCNRKPQAGHLTSGIGGGAGA